ncbi:MAG: DMT family transporter [Hyphomicrobiales bacterium]|nr:DMT family transporter [Hyphomicrobiales bacterium]MDE2116045.1 DMT family transporter [Hyphomicrobiales bacterium]
MVQAQTPSMSLKEWVMMLALSALWGGSFFFFKVLVTEVPPFTVVLGRVGLAALILNLFLILRRDLMPRDPRLWGAFFIVGLLNNVVPYTLIVFGETHISSGLASILNATTPIFTVIIAHVFTANEKLNWGKVAGVAFGFAGVAVLIGPSGLSSLGGSDLGGEAACLLAALTYGFASIYGRRFKGIAPLKVATGQITASTIVLLPLALLIDRPWTIPTPGVEVWLAFGGISLFSTALAYILYFRILATAGATNLMLVTFLLPVSAMTLGVFALGEVVTWQSLAGMALIGLGLAAIDGRLWRRLSVTTHKGLKVYAKGFPRS